MVTLHCNMSVAMQQCEVRRRGFTAAGNCRGTHRSRNKEEYALRCPANPGICPMPKEDAATLLSLQPVLQRLWPPVLQRLLRQAFWRQIWRPVLQRLWRLVFLPQLWRPVLQRLLRQAFWQRLWRPVLQRLLRQAFWQRLWRPVLQRLLRQAFWRQLWQLV